MAVVVLGTTPESAFATHCSKEEQIFQRGDSNARGTINDIRFKERTMALCRDQVLVLSTAHMRLNGVDGVDYVEAGWRGARDYDYNIHWSAFTHWKRNNVTIGSAITNLPGTCLNDNENDRWKVGNSFGTTRWVLEVDCFDGAGWRRLNPTSGFEPTGDNDGIVMGETERFACEESGMAELQTNLQRRLDNGSWVPWSTNLCHFDNTTGWKSTAISATRYITEHGPESCDGVSPC